MRIDTPGSSGKSGGRSVQTYGGGGNYAYKPNSPSTSKPPKPKSSRSSNVVTWGGGGGVAHKPGEKPTQKPKPPKEKWSYQKTHSLPGYKGPQYGGDKAGKHPVKSPTLRNFQDFDVYKSQDKNRGYKNKVSQKSKVIEDVTKASRIKDAAKRRAFREKKGLYLGKYYGPDVFKGDKGLNAAWEKSGKKGSPAAFKTNYRKASSR